MVTKSFTETQLKNLAIEYISYKFEQSLHFAYLTDIHYSIFRYKKHEKENKELQAIIELILLAADIMDDLQDKDSEINPWSKVALGQNLNIIFGLLLISLKKVESIMCTSKTKSFIRNQIYTLMLKSINGQQYDLINQIERESDYIEMTSLKSGSLILLANIMGAGNVSNEKFRAIQKYSNYLGVVAQLRNDVNDLLNNSIKSDLRSKKRTLPIIYYLHIEDPKFSIVKEYFYSNKPYEAMTYEDREDLHKTIVQGGALQYCRVVEQLYIHKFKECVNSLNIPSSAKEQLLNIKI